LRTAFVLGEIKGWHAIVVPRVFAYVGDVVNKPDIADYRGYGDLSLVFGRNDGLALSLTGIIGADGDKGSLQADLTYPLKFDRHLDFATYLLIQYWDGSTESLLDYRDRTSSIRVGFSLVR
jgi:phospholipase A1